MTVSKQDLKNNLEQSVSSTAQTYQSSVKDTANQVVSSFNDATQTKAGQVAGEINGGIQSVTNLTKDVSGKLNAGAVEGVVTDQLSALEGAVNDFGSQPAKTKSAVRIAIAWSDPDSDGNVYPVSSSIDPSSQIDETINAMLAKCTGLQVFNGYVQKIAGNIMPKGQLSLLEQAKGNLGKFPGADALNELTAKANDLAASSSTAINNAVSSVVGATLPPNPAATLQDVGKNLAGTLPPGVADAQTQLQQQGAALTSAVEGSVTKVADGLTTGIDINLNKLSDDFSAQTGKVGKDVLNAASGGFEDQIDKLGAGRDTYNQAVDILISDSKTGVIQGFSEKKNRTGETIVRGLAPKLTSADRDDVIALAQGDQSERDRAAEIIAKSSGKNVDEIKSSLKDLNTTIAGTVIVENEETAFSNPFDLSVSDDYSSPDARFTYISSVEELEAEINQIQREVTEVIVHWTDTYTNKNIGSEEINKIQIDLGLSGIAYHYVIRRDGSLQRGRPVNQKGEHSNINDHDNYSIGIVFVGGINVPSGTSFPGNYRGVSSLTLSQMVTFNAFCQAFYNRYPGGQILGHNDIDPIEEDPGFDVRDYVEDLFNKKSLFDDPSSRGPFSPSELVSAQVP